MPRILHQSWRCSSAGTFQNPILSRVPAPNSTADWAQYTDLSHRIVTPASTGKPLQQPAFKRWELCWSVSHAKHATSVSQSFPQDSWLKVAFPKSYIHLQCTHHCHQTRPQGVSSTVWQHSPASAVPSTSLAHLSTPQPSPCTAPVCWRSARAAHYLNDTQKCCSCSAQFKA